ncbi:MAG: hypothetical protein NTV86_08495 [Planctomycetota bacterium]|nr:hypothetical protein [Planctomycetota bacterium]
MAPRPKCLLWLTAMSCLAAGGCPSMALYQDRPLEIRWRAAVPLKNLEQLKTLDALLDRPPAGVDAGAKLTLVKADNPDVVAVVTTGKEYLAFKRLGYVFKTPADNLLESTFKAATLPLALLAKALPARTSYLQDFSLSREGVASLPASLGLAGEEGNPADARKDRRWGEAFPGSAVQVVDADTIVISDEQAQTRLTVLAFADFDHDGIEDVLLCVANSSRTRSLKLFRYVVLTRKGEGETLLVVRDDS